MGVVRLPSAGREATERSLGFDLLLDITFYPLRRPAGSRLGRPGCGFEPGVSGVLPFNRKPPAEEDIEGGC